MGNKIDLTQEDMMKIFKKYEDCLRWLGQGYMDGVCPKCGQDMVERTGPYGRILACVNPECKHAEQIDLG